jgi:branched-chain amino acid transport system permease protein
VGAVIGACIAAAVGALLAVPLLRLNGIWIAIATLAFAYFFDSVIVKFPWAGGTADSSATQVVPRPVIGPWTLDGDKGFLVLVLIVLAVMVVGVNLFSRSTTGRTLRALRGSEVAAQSIGISPARARLVVFAVSAFVAALGGAFVSIHQKNVNYGNNFSPFAGLFWLVLVVTFGARKPSGALWGAANFSLLDKVVLQGTFLGWILRDPGRIPSLFPISPSWRLILFGLGTIQYAKHPEGVIDLVRVRGQQRRAKRAAKKAGSAGPDGPVAASVVAPAPAAVGERV